MIPKDSAVTHFDDPFRLLRHVRLVRHEHDRDTLLIQFLEQRHHFDRHAAVEVSRGLVREEELGRRHQRTRNGHTLLLAARQLTGLVIQPIAESHATERVGLGERVDHHPSELSGGQQQRVAIARALVTQPTLLLADEPTGNLDSRTTVEVMALFQALNDQGITIVLVTHEPEVAHYARRVVEVRDGRIVRDHPVERRHDAAADLREMDAPDTTDLMEEAA